eukprot:UN24616
MSYFEWFSGCVFDKVSELQFDICSRDDITQRWFRDEFTEVFPNVEVLKVYVRDSPDIKNPSCEDEDLIRELLSVAKTTCLANLKKGIKVDIIYSLVRKNVTLHFISGTKHSYFKLE